MCSVRFKSVGDPGNEDQVKRKERFLERHPGVRIDTVSSPLAFRATYRDDDGPKAVTRYDLRNLLDLLEGVLDLS
jgi:hypothetical protein